MQLVRPTLSHLPSYRAALERGWSADNVRGPAAAAGIAAYGMYQVVRAVTGDTGLMHMATAVGTPLDLGPPTRHVVVMGVAVLAAMQTGQSQEEAVNS